VKLVHHSIEQRAAGMFFLAIAPRFEAASLRVEHEPVGTEERPLLGPAVARCLIHHVMVHSARSYTRRNTSFSALKLRSAPARDVAYSQRSCSHESERDPDATVVIPGISSPPLNTRVLCTRLFERPNGSSQAQPLSQALIQFCQRLTDEPRLCTLVILLRQHLSLNDPFGGGPTDDTSALGTRWTPAVAEYPTSRHILDLKVAPRKK
jgi:hypothetical protein